MKIPHDKIEEVKSSTDIVQIVSEFVQLKKRGSNFIGLCPFHKEKTPSFNVNPSIGIFKCFGCGKGGDVVSFLMEMEGSSFIETIRSLAEKAQIPLPEDDEDQEKASEYESIYAALRYAARFFFDQLVHSEEGKSRALTYFKGRGFSNKIIKHFGLGYAPDAWNGLLTRATSEGIKESYLEKAGLIIPGKSEGYYDRFRGRAIFPIFSHVGKVIGFGGRQLDDDKTQPKYINSPETTVYKKSQVLYGLFQARQALRAERIAILVEGYTDVISLHQAGILNVVASSGTALTEDQVRLLGRYASKVLIIYDADSAGAEAAVRGIDLLFEQGITPSIVTLPDGADPDGYVMRFGAKSFRNLLEREQKDFIQFRIEKAVREGLWDVPEERSKVVHEMIRTISRIPDAIVQDGYLRSLADRLGIPESELRKILMSEQKGVRRQLPQTDTSRIPETGPDISHPDASVPPQTAPLPAEDTLIRLMLEEGKYMVGYVLQVMAVEEFTEGAPRVIVERLMDMYLNDQLDAKEFLGEKYSTEIREYVAGLQVSLYELSPRWEDKAKTKPISWKANPKETALGAMSQIKLHRINQAIREQQRALFEARKAKADVEALLDNMKTLLELKKQVEQKEFIDWEVG